MPFYRLFILDSHDRIVGPSIELYADDDRSAVNAAREQQDWRTIEVWSFSCRIARLKPGGLNPSSEGDASESNPTL